MQQQDKFALNISGRELWALQACCHTHKITYKLKRLQEKCQFLKFSAFSSNVIK